MADFPFSVRLRFISLRQNLSASSSAMTLALRLRGKSLKQTASGGAATPTPTPTPTASGSFTTLPSVSPNGGTVGQAFAGVDGVVSNGSITGRRWLLNGNQVSTSATYVSTAVGSLVFEVAAIGTDGVPFIASTAAVSVVAVGATPDGALEAVISPANTTLRATYSFTKTGAAYAIEKNAYNGNGVYWPNRPRRLLVPNPKYPDLFISYYTPDHGAGASGFYAALCNGDPTVLSNWRQYDDVIANTDWLSHLSNLPTANPILIGPQAQLETICIIPYNGKWIFHGQMTSVPGGRNQGTVRAVTTDGFNFVLQNQSLLIPTDYTDGHTGYLTGGPNQFPGIIDPLTGVMALYAGWSLHGGQTRSTLALWVTDNPETGTWRLIQTFGKIIGRNALGSIGNWFSFAFINMDWGSIRQTRQGWSFITEGAARGSGASARPGDMFEVLVADDGRTMLGKPQLLIARGGTGTLDNGEISRGEGFVFGDKFGFIYEAADSTNTKVAAIATSPLRNPQNTWFEPLTPAIPAYVTKQVNFITASAIPAGFTAVTTGAPSVAFSASGAAITMAPNDAYFLFEDAGFDPATTDYVDIFLDNFRTLVGPNTAARIPYIGFATSKTARSAMTDAFFLSNGESTLGTMAYTALVAGGVTSRASDYVYGIGYLANTSQTTNGPKNKGIRWFPKSNEAFVLEEGAEGEPIKTSTVNYPATLDKTKRWYPFIGFVSTGTTSITEQIGKMIVRVADSGAGAAPAPAPAPTPTMNIGSDVSQSEGDSGTTNYNYTVTRSSTTGATSATWSVAGSGTNPAAASDFVGGVLPSGTINFADGVATATITVPVAGDTTVETNEGFTVTIVPASGYTSTRAAAGGSIANDDAPPAGTPATFQNRYQASSTANATTYTFATVPLGAEAATRKLRVYGEFRAAAANASPPTATFTPDGGSAIAMTQIALRKSTYDGGESTVIGFTVDVPTGAQGTVTFTVPGGAVRAGLDSVCTVNAATTPVDVQTVELLNAGAAVLSLSINRVQNGILFGVAQYSTTSSTFHSSAIEVPSATANASNVSFTSNNSATAAWTGIANGDAGLVTEATGSAGTVLLIMSFAPA